MSARDPIEAAATAALLAADFELTADEIDWHQRENTMLWQRACTQCRAAIAAYLRARAQGSGITFSAMEALEVLAAEVERGENRG